MVQALWSHRIPVKKSWHSSLASKFNGIISKQKRSGISGPYFFGGKLFSHLLEAFGADSFSLAVDLFRLKINTEFSQGFDVGMTNRIAALGSSAADIAYSRHRFLG